jgi:hypothetical protein
MSPDQQTPNPTSETNTPALVPTPSATPTPPAAKGTSKAVVIGFAVAAVVIALLIAVVAFMLMNQGVGDTDNQNTNETGNNQNDPNETTPPASNKVIATQESAKSGLFVDLYEPKKVGETLVINYKVYNKESDDTISGWASAAGIYVVKGVAFAPPEPYAIANSDGQKYGLVKDDQGEPLASKEKTVSLKKGQSYTGFVTLTLPPNNTTVSISLGSMSAFNDIKISY